MFIAAKKFSIPTLDLKVFDDSKTEVDEEVFELLLKSPNLGVLEICEAQDLHPEGKVSFVYFCELFLVILVGLTNRDRNVFPDQYRHVDVHLISPI